MDTFRLFDLFTNLKKRIANSRMFSTSQSYNAVNDVDSEFYLPKPSNQGLLKPFLLILTTTILAIELIFIISRPNSQPLPTSLNSNKLSLYKLANSSGYAGCGDSEESALARGCKFDHLTISWETPECYDTDTITDFYALDDWQYYSDPNGTHVSTKESYKDGHRRYNVKWGFHVTHCVYTWKIMQKAVFERRPLPDNLLDLEHTRHCMEMMLDRRFPWNDMHTMIHVKWPMCASFEDWDKAKWVENLILPEEEVINN